MLRNYLKIAARHLWHQRSYTAMNVGGVAVGMATCLLIGLYVQDELSYDTFHPQADRIHVVTMERSGETTRKTPYRLSTLLNRKVPGVRRATRTERGARERTIRYEGEGTSIERTQRVLKADSSFFEVFSGFRMRRGHEPVLDAPGEAVISAASAEAFFGSENPVGKTVVREAITFGERTLRPSQSYTIVGVTDVPENSTFQFDVVVSIGEVSDRRRAWGSFAYYTYAQVDSGLSREAFTESVARVLPKEVKQHVGSIGALPLPELYFSTFHATEGFKGQPRSLYIFGTIALLILLIAGINYVNLATAQAEQRAREVGVRKTMGASRRQVAYQFLGEALLVSGMSLVVAVVLVTGALPAFNALFDVTLSLSTARHGWALLNGIGVVVVVSLLAGAYPAFVLSRFAPTRILRGASTTTTRSGGWLRKGLVMTQFAASAGLILGTIVIYQQLDYVQTKDLGFDDEQVVTVDLGDLSERRKHILRRKIRGHPDVEQVTIGSSVPGRGRTGFPGASQEFSPAARTTTDTITIGPAEVDTNYVELLGLNLLAGQSFADHRRSGQQTQGYILNESAAKAFGWSPGDAIGKPFRVDHYGDDPFGTVIGVVEDFHVESLRTAVRPVVLMTEFDRLTPAPILTARLAPEGIRPGMDHIQSVMADVAPETAFDYTFLDDKFDAMYRSERRLARIFGAFAVIAVVVACMGLFALAAFAAQRRTKEIGIRKTLGATAISIVGLLSKEYAVLLAVGFAVGMPVAYVGIERWLQDFAYRVDVGVGPFFWTAGLAALLAGLSVSVHALRAARTDPATTLRDE